MALVRVDKRRVKKTIRESGKWSGFMIRAKVHPFHVRNGWRLGCPVSFDSLDSMELILNEWTYYNACWKLGYYPAYYQEELC